jgi:hypothetical protein
MLGVRLQELTMARSTTLTPPRKDPLLIDDHLSLLQSEKEDMGMLLERVVITVF